MALTGKLALLASLSFIGTMSWLISQVARPILEQTTPLVARGQDSRRADAYATADNARRPIEQRGDSAIKKQFQHTSTLADVNQPQAVASEALVTLAEDIPAAGRELPPMYVPAEPIVTRIEPPAAEPVPDEPLVPNGKAYAAVERAATSEAALVEGHANVRPTMLMALRPEETTGVGFGWEMSKSEPAAPVQQYKVQSGDSLQKITKRFWNRTDAEAIRLLVAANPELAKRKDRIYAGETLNIPDPGNVSPKSAVTQAAPTPSKKTNEAKPAAKGKASGKEKETEVRWYTIQKQDSLAGIAKRVLNDPNRWREIAELNGLRDADRIVPGAKIKLPSPRTET